MKPVFVYFFGCAAGLVKIGISTNPDKRLASIVAQTGLPLESLVEVRGSREIEKALHKRFRAYGIGREWFIFGDETETLVRALLACRDDEEREMLLLEESQRPQTPEVVAAAKALRAEQVQNLDHPVKGRLIPRDEVERLFLDAGVHRSMFLMCSPRPFVRVNGAEFMFERDVRFTPREAECLNRPWAFVESENA